MRDRTRVLDSRYLEFIEYLQKLGELKSITRLISNLCDQNETATKMPGKYGRKCLQENTTSSRLIYLFWQRRWIEVREIEKKRDNGIMKEYVIKLSLKEIFDYLCEAKMHSSGTFGFSKRQNYAAESVRQYPAEETLLEA